MKKKSISVCATIISIAFALAVAYFFYSLVYEYRRGIERTGRLFDNLVASTRYAAASYKTDSAEFREAFDKALGDRSSYEFVTLKEGSHILFSYPDSNVTALSVSHFCEEHTSSFSTGDGTYILTASIYALRPDSIFYHARFAFLIILAATAAAIILIVYISLSNRSRSVDNDTDSDDNMANDDYNDDKSDVDDIDDIYDIDEINTGDKIDDIDNSDGINTSDDIDVINDIDNMLEDVYGQDYGETAFTENNDADDVHDESAFDNSLPVDEETAETKPDKIEDDFESEITWQEIEPHIDEEGVHENSPQNFSAVTGLVHERNLEERLDIELKRAAELEQELSLFLIRIPSVSLSASAAMGICDYLLEQFKYKDTIFEHGADGFAAIKEKCTVDDALTFADALYGSISKLLKDADSTANCAIGVSSRSLRVLSAERLLMEATEALENALADETKPIVAFRADAEKYKRIVEKEE